MRNLLRCNISIPGHMTLAIKLLTFQNLVPVTVPFQNPVLQVRWSLCNSFACVVVENRQYVLLLKVECKESLF